MPIDIDEMDLTLIRELHNDGRRSYASLAKDMGVVEGTIRNRVRKLINDKLIFIRAIPHVRQMGFRFVGVMGIQVRMDDLRNVANHLAEQPNVCYLAFVTGRYDLMAIVLTRSPEEMSAFIERKISSLPTITRTETFVTLDIIKGTSYGLDTRGLIDTITLPPENGNTQPISKGSK